MELVVDRICQELSLPRPSVASVVGLLGEGNTVPFIARYRKEATGSLDEVAIRAIEDNWVGHEILQAKAKNKAPKYGRDDDEADANRERPAARILGVE